MSNAKSKARVINAKSVVTYIRTGLSDTDIMAKYVLTRNQLDHVFQGLLDSGAIAEMELFERSTLTDSVMNSAMSDE